MRKQFKVGDKVRYVGNSGWVFLDGREGDIFTVHELVPDSTTQRVWLRIVEGLGASPKHTQPLGCFELVERARNLKVGDKVRVLDETGSAGLLKRGAIHTVAKVYAENIGEVVNLAGLGSHPWIVTRFERVETVKFDPLTWAALDALFYEKLGATIKGTCRWTGPTFQNLPKGKVRLVENGTLLTTEFDTEGDATQWLKDNECVGSFDMVRVIPLSKLTVKTAIVVEAA